MSPDPSATAPSATTSHGKADSDSISLTATSRVLQPTGSYPEGQRRLRPEQPLPRQEQAPEGGPEEDGNDFPEVTGWLSEVPHTWHTGLTLGLNPQSKQMGEHTSGSWDWKGGGDKQLPGLVQAAEQADGGSCSCSRQGWQPLSQGL